MKKMLLMVFLMSVTMNMFAQFEQRRRSNSTGTQQTSTSNRNNNKPSSNSQSSNSGSNDESDVKLGFVYMAGSFDDVKASGHYGFMSEALNISDSGFGTTFAALFNYGLVDKKYASGMALLGPNYSFSVANSGDTKVIIPACIAFSYLGDDYKKITGHNTAWGWTINPSICFGAIQVGLMINGGFESGSKTQVGFTAGLMF